MNDPGLEGPIDDVGEQVRDNVHHMQESEVADGMEEEEQERNYLLPARWWYASTGIPLIAGTFGPIANAFSVCALVEDWRVKIPPNGTEEHGIPIKDPKWLIAVNAVSLVCALIANLFLLLNMARRVSFKIAQPITILGFWMASILLIALIAVAAHDFHAPGVKSQALSQAYYYAIFAAGLYQIISYLMCITVYGAYKGYYSKEFKLTVAQRTLMLQTIAFLVYQLLGALVYSKIEGWMFLDAVFWADFTLLTIGLGDDYTPQTHLGRGLVFPFAIGGIIILGLVVGSIRSLVLDRGKKKMASRLTEKTRARLVKQVERSMKKKNRLRPKGVMGLEKGIVNALTAPPEESEVPELDRRAAEFAAMRKVQERADTERKYMSLVFSSVAAAFLWFIGAAVFYSTEKNQSWSYFEALYFSYTTLLTIGYGDFQPVSNSGKPFFVFWSLLAVPALTILISDMGDTVVKSIKDVTIWIGEVTVLPSDEGSVKERLKHGVYKATLGKVDSRATRREDLEEGEDSDEEGGYQELHPGLARIFRGGNDRHGRGKGRRAAADRLAADFQRSEEVDESIARGHRHRSDEDEHHYRHVLLSQIRRVYADTLASTPKKYSYADWAYFLKLLGEDESDETVHKTPGAVVAEEGPNAVASAREQALNSSGQEAASDPKDKEDAHQKAEKQKWSWIGVRSPLMGDQEEAEWLLEKFFQRLEESLHGEGLEKEDKIKRETAKHHPSQQGQEEAGGDEGASDEGSSEDTISRGEPNEAKDKDNN